MSDINVKCVDQTLTITNAPVIASGGVGEDRVVFDFCPLWDGYVKTVMFFTNTNEGYSVLVNNNAAVIPAEVMASEGFANFGVIGVNGNVTRTSEVLRYNIVRGANTVITPAPTLDIYTQILQAISGTVIPEEVREQHYRAGLKFWVGTQAQYNALTPANGTMYIITDVDPLTAHTSNTSNPHSVTYTQVGAAPTSHNHSGHTLTPTAVNMSTTSENAELNSHSATYTQNGQVNVLKTQRTGGSITATKAAVATPDTIVSGVKIDADGVYKRSNNDWVSIFDKFDSTRISMSQNLQTQAGNETESMVIEPDEINNSRTGGTTSYNSINDYNGTSVSMTTPSEVIYSGVIASGFSCGRANTSAPSVPTAGVSINTSGFAQYDPSTQTYKYMTDYVYEETTVSSWKIRKWKSGRIEAERTVSYSDPTFASWVSPLYNCLKTVTLPSNVFTTITKCDVDCNNPYCWISGVLDSSSQISFNIVSPMNIGSGNTIKARIRIIGV